MVAEWKSIIARYTMPRRTCWLRALRLGDMLHPFPNSKPCMIHSALPSPKPKGSHDTPLPGLANAGTGVVAMILPIHLAAGAFSQRLTRKWYLWVPLAFFSHQVLDWTSGRIWHEFNPDKMVTMASWPFVVLSIVGAIVIAWYGRRQWTGMLVAISPDLIDHVPGALGLTTRSQWLPIHRWFWSARWQQPEWALAWLILATLILVLILKERA